MTKKQQRLSDRDLRNAVEAWVIDAIRKKHYRFYPSEIGIDLGEDILRVRDVLEELVKEGKVRRVS